MVGIEKNSDRFLGFDFWRKVQRRGTDVSTPEIGSRGAIKCFGGILRFHAELRRELKWGNLVWVFFGVLLGEPRGAH
jgi:hypothetical protein